MKKRYKNISRLLIIIVAFSVGVFKVLSESNKQYTVPDNDEYYITINDNIPEFDSIKFIEGYEYYGELDNLGRCTVTEALITPLSMPTEERGSIGMIKPTGWHTVRYQSIEDKYLYNRCHLIGYQLTGENDNERNLITGTRQMNIKGMLPFENAVADYVRDTGNSVMYRAEPIFTGDNLLADGVHIEAQSVQDDTISFNVFCYNTQAGIAIDYSDGESKLAE